jgi:hypothetical protein
VEIEGEVVGTRWHDNGHGRQLLMTVRHEEGWEVTGSVPAAIERVQKGDRVRFMARLEPREESPARGRFARPTQAEIL